jgi:hypothetical protein
MTPEMAVVPPGGHRFFQRLPNGNMQLFVGLNEDDLVKQVRMFRLNNNIDLGDVAADIKKGISTQSHKLTGDQRSLRERVTGWKSNRAFQQLDFVMPEVAEARAKVCVDCPFNQANYADSCIECHAHVERDLYAMRQGKTTDQDQWLGGCQICGHENKTAVQLAPENLLHRNTYLKELEEKHPACWLLHLADEPVKEVDS